MNAIAAKIIDMSKNNEHLNAILKEVNVIEIKNGPVHRRVANLSLSLRFKSTRV